MPEAKRVGTLHAHSLPEITDVARYDVYRCTCDTEFYMNFNEEKNPDWFRVNESPHFVSYESHDEGEPEIGRWDASKRPVPPEGSGANDTDDGIVIVDRQPKTDESESEETGGESTDANTSTD